MNDIYLMNVRNVALNIRARSAAERDSDKNAFDIWQAAQVLATAWAKLPADVLNDLISIEISPTVLDEAIRVKRYTAKV